jgi:uncharacterized protein YbjT (DUF2867 family)
MKILLTGATGYIGRRLLPVLVNDGAQVVCLVRDAGRLVLEDDLQGKVEVIEADLLDEDSLNKIPEDIDAAYYLVHSMSGGHGNFQKKEENSARNFQQAVNKTQAKQIIYLSGISNDEDKELSEHLQSRLHVEDVLAEGEVPVTVLRAAIIIGSGSSSFEIIRDLVEKLPVMIAPKWIETKCQPIGVHNVLQYLKGVLLCQEAIGQTFDIGGPNILTYRQMMLQFAEARGLKRYIITVPVMTPRLSSYWLYLVTSTSFALARNLVDSMHNEVIQKDKRIRDIIPQKLYSYKTAVKKAFAKIEQNEVISSWKDAVMSNRITGRLQEYVQVPTHGCFVDKKSVEFKPTLRPQVVNNLWQIGGNRGWYYWNRLWKLRGWLDKLVGGVGLRRGRRSPNQIGAGDALDFWRVLVADKMKGRLLLYAEMKLPGEAWLEFCIKECEGQDPELLQTATFRPKGLLGRLYWYSVWPFHLFIFKGMINRIVHYQEEDQQAKLQLENQHLVEA